MNQDEFNKALSSGIVHFAYRKKDGSLRIARGTTKLENIPTEFHPKGTGSEKNNVKPYWDLNSEGWRAFNPLALIWATKDTGELILQENLTHLENLTIAAYVGETF